MKIEEVRASFTVYLIASELNQFDGIGESLRLAGYLAATFSELTAAFSEFPSNPPHFLIFDAGEKRFSLSKAIKQVGQQLPESHIFLLTPVERREEFVSWLEENVYDLIYTPLISPVELLRSLDRAAERDYFMYMNERLTETVQSFEGHSSGGQSGGTVMIHPNEAVEQTTLSGSATNEVTRVAMAPQLEGENSRYEHLHFARELFDTKAPDECLQIFLRMASRALGDSGAVFFKYVANRRVLLASSAIHLENIDLGGLGVNLNEEGSQFKSVYLRDPMGVTQITDMVREVFGVEDFFAYPVEAMGEVQGIVVFLHPHPDGDLNAVLTDWLMLTNRALSALECDRRLHVTAVKDPITELLNRANFLGKVQQEVSRARRTTLPVSVLLLTVDAYGQIISDQGPEEANTILRVVGRILEKHSRVNDVLGRTGADEFAILLPHTGRNGATIKAERLRRLLASADFSKVLSAYPQITVSVGVSEYPSLVRDAEELIQAANEALDSVRKEGNRTCVAQPPDNFVPDFPVQEKGGT